MPNARYELPYKGTKPMLLVDNVDDANYIVALFNISFNYLPAENLKNIKYVDYVK